jgi:glycosyltransferase involved in cell wall biosynthesis
MTAYNREKYIAEAIESVLAQTFTDFELVIVDDCSSDRTVEIARRYTTDPRVLVHINGNNLGDYPNRNRAAGLARGRYLKYLDSDDMMYPHCLETMARQMEQYLEAGVGFEGKENHNWPRPFPFVLSPEEAYQAHFFGRGVLSAGPTSAIIRANVFREFGGFSAQRYMGDTEFWYRVTRRTPLLICYGGLTWWRQHPGQEIRGEASLGSAIASRYHLDVSAVTAKDCPLAARDRLMALRRMKRIYLRRIASTAAHGRLRTAWAFYRGMRDVEK